MSILGQFRDLDDPDQFVWIRSFPDMQSRHEALQAFYTGRVWKTYSAQANATMLDVSNVLLLQPLGPQPPLPAHRTGERRTIVATIVHVNGEPDTAPAIRPAPLALLQTLKAPNTFPALPIRGDADVVCWLQHDHPGEVPACLPGTVEQLRLSPTDRSLLR
jgi:hypothetical protein